MDCLLKLLASVFLLLHDCMQTGKQVDTGDYCFREAMTTS